MHRRDVGRMFSMVAVVGVIFVLVASCGGSGGDVSGGLDASTFDGFNPGTFSQDANGTMGGSCAPATCASLGYNCGTNADGCGGTIDCGACSGSDLCGIGGFSKCGNPLVSADGGVACAPKGCADYGTDACGQQSDGCGGLTANCGTCTTPQFCGGGSPGTCGGDINKTVDGGPKCLPSTCASLGYDCGLAGDGCGGTVGPCGTGSCASPQFCGGGGPNKCGGSTGFGADGGPLVTCVPKTCSGLGATCGVAGDGCGGTTPLCGTCTSPQFCGGGGASKCGGNNGVAADGGILCTARTCASYGANACGQQSDGCGGLTVNCGSCTSPQFCGGGGPGKCGGNDTISPDGGPVNCRPATCASLGYNCGMAGDGCGGTLGPCGPACVAPQACGAGTKPNVCGSSLPCTGLCTKQVACDSGSTTLTGTVVAGTPSTYLPSGVALGDPVPNVLVYIPNGTVSAFVSRANETAAQQCTTCGADVSGSPLVTTYTAYDGTFTLTNVPVGANIPVVIQLGRWRRQFTVNINSSCTANTVVALNATSNGNPIPAGTLAMPNKQSEGDIPLTALSTGNVDAMECVLLKMGVDPAEFTKSSGTGRIHLYKGNGANAGNNTPNEAALMDTGGTFNQYDQIILPCWGVDPVGNNSSRKSATELADLVSYGSAGGHFFATHFSYAWLTQPWAPPNNGAFVATANWDVDHNTGIDSTTGVVSQSVPPTTPATTPGTFVLWLNKIQALANFTAAPPPPNPADVTLSTVRHDVDSVAGQSVEWIDGTDPVDASKMLLHFTFDTPVNQASQCGHAIFSDFHVTNATTTSAYNFTAANDRGAECGTVPMTPQEKILEYMIWDLASCVPAPPTSTCVPKTCANFPGTCGQQGDGCGGLTTNCGSCPTGQVCGGGGVANQCGTPDGGPCTALTCASYPTGTCGPQTDGCGGTTPNCANCPAGQSCGGGGTPGVCGAPPGDTCTKMTCAAYPGICGPQSDGCGGLTPDCSPCPTGQTCGGGGTPGVCGAPPGNTCQPLTCSEQNIDCGPAGDGCGNVIASCGTCPTPQTCGGGGVPGQCGGMNTCIPLTCMAQNVACGPAGDGCGNLVQGGCGVCTPPATCGGGGVSGQCGGTKGCVPETCRSLNITCGPAGDGCGNLIPSCGTCAPPASCGGGGVAGQCGAPIPK